MKKLLFTVMTLLLYGFSIHAQVYTVNTTLDSFDDGDCSNGKCTLREAIALAESDGVASTIHFNIEDCPNDICTIDLVLGIFNIMSEEDLVIDGTTQPFNFPMDSRIILNTEFMGGASPIFAIQKPGIEIYGLHLTNLAGTTITGKGIEIYEDNVTIGAFEKGNVIERTDSYGIYVDSNRRNITIQHNAIGTAFDKSLGGVPPMMDYGIWAAPVITNLIINSNLIAYQEGDAIYLETSGATVTDNEICFSGNYGLQVDNNQKNNLIQSNSFYCNAKAGIELNGGNQGISPPFINYASPSLITGTANPYDIIEIFISDDTNCTGVPCQGKQILGRIITNSSGNWQFNLPYSLSQNSKITATATDDQMNTSQFSSCALVSIDDCFQAALLPINNDPCGRISRTASLEGAAPYTPFPVSSCAGTYVGGDIWFKVEVPTSGNLLIRTHANTNIDATIEAYASCPTFTTPTLIKCQEMNIAPNVMTLTALLAGSTVYLRVWEQNNTVVNGTGIATIELSAHALSNNSNDWELCDTPMTEGADNSSDFGGGRRKANEFILQYNACATPDDINLMTNELFAMGAILRDQCTCADPLIQLWGESDPIALEACKKAAAKRKSRVDTTNYNYIVEDLDCQEIEITPTTFNAVFEAFVTNSYTTTSGNLIYEFAQTSTTDNISGYYEYNTAGNWLGGYISGTISGYSYIGNIVSINTTSSPDSAMVSGVVYDDLGQPIATLTGEVADFILSNNYTDVDITTVIDIYNKIPCNSKGIPFPFSTYSPNSTFYDVVIGVSDTGIDLPPGAFSNVVWNNSAANTCIFGDDNGYNFFANNGDYNDIDGHGSAVSGILTSGFPSDIDLDIMPLKFYENGSGTVFDGICSIHYAAEKGADILNLSWGFESTEFPEILYDAVGRASCEDILIVTSAGNRGTSNDLVEKWPANLDLNNIITVAGYDDCDGMIVRSDFSNYGSMSVDIAAPGFAQTISHIGGLKFSAGTSIATPFVAQTAAIIKAQFPEMSSFDIRDCILSTAEFQESLKDTVVTQGILNQAAAINCATSKFFESVNCYTLQHTANVIHEVCWGEDGEIDLTITNGVAPYTYQWSNGATTQDLSQLSAACYRVDVADTNGCKGVFSIIVEQRCGVRVAPKVMLQGPLDSGSGLMNDDLDLNGLMPYSEPYGTEQGEIYMPVSVPSLGDWPVDWVLVELRDKNDPTQILAVRAAILQRDGDVVDMDGFSPIIFGKVPEDNYYVSIKHRNHLGVMSEGTYFLSK